MNHQATREKQQRLPNEVQQMIAAIVDDIIERSGTDCTACCTENRQY